MEQKALWKAGSHVRGHVTPTRSLRRSVRISAGASSNGFDLPTDDLAEWFAQNPRTEATPTKSQIPAGEVDTKTSGVFGVYNQIPQVPYRLFQTYVDVEREAVETGKLRVRDPRNSNALLTRALSLPVTRYHFA